jgi:hypothetical protein
MARQNQIPSLSADLDSVSPADLDFARSGQFRMRGTPAMKCGRSQDARLRCCPALMDWSVLGNAAAFRLDLGAFYPTDELSVEVARYTFLNRRCTRRATEAGIRSVRYTRLPGC